MAQLATDCVGTYGIRGLFLILAASTFACQCARPLLRTGRRNASDYARCVEDEEVPPQEAPPMSETASTVSDGDAFEDIGEEEVGAGRH